VAARTDGVFAYDEVMWVQVKAGTALCVGDVICGFMLEPRAVADMRSRI
jgi:hypothetical protein